MALPSIIILLFLPPGVAQTANDGLSESRRRQWVRQRAAQRAIGGCQQCDNLVAHKKIMKEIRNNTFLCGSAYFKICQLLSCSSLHRFHILNWLHRVFLLCPIKIAFFIVKWNENLALVWTCFNVKNMKALSSHNSDSCYRTSRIHLCVI